MKEKDPLKYFIAAEKVGKVIISIEMLLEFIQEFGIEADVVVKEQLEIRLIRLKEWIK